MHREYQGMGTKRWHSDCLSKIYETAAALVPESPFSGNEKKADANLFDIDTGRIGHCPPKSAQPRPSRARGVGGAVYKPRETRLK